MSTIATSRLLGLRPMTRPGPWVSRLWLALTVLALLGPSLSAFHVDLAGWAPNHGHVYPGGIPVPHAHPYDEIGEGARPLTAHAHVHADGSVHFHHDAESAPSDAGEVTFTWDTGTTVFVALVPAAVSFVATAAFLPILLRLPADALASPPDDTPAPPPR